MSAWVNAWCNEVKAKTGAVPIVYTYISYANTWLDATVSQTWPLWMANYLAGADPQKPSPERWEQGFVYLIFPVKKNSKVFFFWINNSNVYLLRIKSLWILLLLSTYI